jgi:hypothetical protein
MSTNLFWHPVVPQSEKMLSKSLKFVLQRNLPELEEGGAITLNFGHLPYLTGLSQGLDLMKCTGPELNEVNELMRAIRHHGKIELRVKE